MDNCCSFVALILIGLSSSCYADDGHTLAEGIFYETGGQPIAIECGDFDLDGDIDLAIADFNDQVLIFFNDGEGSFGLDRMIPVQTNGRGLFLSQSGDLDSNGYLDLAIMHEGESYSVLLNQGDGSFEVSKPTFVDPSQGKSFSGPQFKIGDLDSDGDLDLAAIAFRFPDLNTELAVFTNDGRGEFTVEFFGVQISNGLALGDLDNDGDLDALIPDYIYLNNGIGTEWQQAFFPVFFGRNPVIADFNADGNQDVALKSNEEITVSLAEEIGRFETTVYTSFSSFSAHSMLTAQDFNNDSYPDLFWVSTDASAIFYLQNRGDGTFAAEQQFVVGGMQPRDFCLDDFDGDGDVDLAVVNFGSGDFAVLFNVCPLLGDVNLDGIIDLLDVAGFVDLLSGGLFQAEADINLDGVVDLEDEALFIDLLLP